MKVLVTGGAGFIGSHVVDLLVARGDKVLVVDDLSGGLTANLPPGVVLERRCLGVDPIIDLVDTWRPEAVVHAAAQASVSDSVTDPVRDARTNVVGGLAVLQAASAIECARFVYLNTGGRCTRKRPIDQQPRPIRSPP